MWTIQVGIPFTDFESLFKSQKCRLCTSCGSVLCSAAQSCLILCNPMDCSPPGFSVHGIFPARTPEWVATSSSGGSPRPRDGTHMSYFSCIARGFFTTELRYERWAYVGTVACLSWLKTPKSKKSSQNTRKSFYYLLATKLDPWLMNTHRNES